MFIVGLVTLFTNLFSFILLKRALVWNVWTVDGVLDTIGLAVVGVLKPVFIIGFVVLVDLTDSGILLLILDGVVGWLDENLLRKLEAAVLVLANKLLGVLAIYLYFFY